MLSYLSPHITVAIYRWLSFWKCFKFKQFFPLLCTLILITLFASPFFSQFFFHNKTNYHYCYTPKRLYIVCHLFLKTLIFHFQSGCFGEDEHSIVCTSIVVSIVSISRHSWYSQESHNLCCSSGKYTNDWLNNYTVMSYDTAGITNIFYCLMWNV